MDVRSLVGEAHFFEETVNADRIKKLLDNTATGTNSHAAAMEKTEGMKYLLAQMARGGDVTPFFADVVRNVVVKNVAVKKLVYMYLVQNADANADCRQLALMAISAFQRDLADSNQMIRALALRVLCSIRVHEIVQIQLMSIRKSAYDPSPYVRKTAAHAVCKVHQLAPEERDELIGILQRLLEDGNIMVLSSAMNAFTEICPENWELIHRQYRKLCRVLPDMEEWGQITTLNVLLRYARTQFRNPRGEKEGEEEEGAGPAGAGGRKQRRNKARRSGFYSDEESETASEEASEEEEDENVTLDADHQLLLQGAMPLLRSRNAGVVLAVASVYHYLAPRNRLEGSKVGRALVRIMRGHREIRYVALSNIAALAKEAPYMFRRYLKDFFVAESEPAFVKKKKVEILVSLAAMDNVGLILREFSRYVRDDSKDFVRACIEAIAQLADALPTVADRCLRGLMGLVRTDHPDVVAASVVVIRQLLQQHPEHETAISQLARLLQTIRAPTARAAIVWIVGEFQSKPRIAAVAPDILRVLARGFRDEAREVKLQVVNLAAKVALRNPDVEVVQSMLQYVLELARFDQDYDLRDRARLLRTLLLSEDEEMRERGRAVVLASKPPPQVEEASLELTRPSHVLGSLSFLVGHAARGFIPLPAWRTSKPDATLRDPAPETPSTRGREKKRKDMDKVARQGDVEGFYREESSSEDSEDSEGSEESSGSSGNGSESESSSGSESESSGNESDGNESDGNESSSSSSESSDEEEEEEEEE